MKTIIHAVNIHASPEAVYRSLTTAQGLSGWWTTVVEVEEREGGLIRFTFHGDFHPRMQQVKLAPQRRVEWKCVGGHENWADNTFTFQLEKRGQDTHLGFVQQYAQELSDEFYGIYNFNWGYYLNSLKKLCETGKGAPFEPPA